VSDRRNFTPIRLEKVAFQQRHVSASMRRAVKQSSHIPWPKVTIRHDADGPVRVTQDEVHTSS
jgi:hypothetical protein